MIELAVAKAPVGAYNLTPHPYWLIILAMGAAHGTVVGLLSAVIGLAIQCVGLCISGMSVPGALALMMSDPVPLLCFLGAGFLVGEIHDAHAAVFRRVQKKLQLESQSAAQVSYQRDLLLEANRRLKDRIEELPVHVADAFDSTTRMERSGAKERFGVLLNLVRKHCGASKASVVELATDGTMTIRSHEGWTDEDERERSAHATSSKVIAHALHQEKAVKAFEISGPLGPYEPLFVAPLRDATGNVRALLCVDEMPTQLLSPESAAVFVGIAEWAETSARLHTGIADDGAASHATRSFLVTSSEALAERLHVEGHRAERYGTPLTLIGFHVDGWTHESRGALAALDESMGIQIPHLLGENAFVGTEIHRFGYPGCYVMVVVGDETPFSESELVGAWHVVGQDSFPLAATHIALDANTPDVHAILMELSTRFRQRSAIALPEQSPISMPTQGRVRDLDALLRRASVEAELAERTGEPCQLVLLHSATPTSSNQVRAHVERSPDTLRPTDGVYVLESSSLALLLPNTTARQAEVATTRFLDAVETSPGLSGRTDIRIDMMSIDKASCDASSILRRVGVTL